MKIILAVLLLWASCAFASITEPGGVVDQNTQARGSLIFTHGTIATGGVSQVALSAGTFRKYILLQNPSGATESLFFSFGTTTAASTTTIELIAGASVVFETLFITTDQLNVYAATTGHAYNLMSNQ